MGFHSQCEYSKWTEVVTLKQLTNDMVTINISGYITDGGSNIALFFLSCQLLIVFVGFVKAKAN